MTRAMSKRVIHAKTKSRAPKPAAIDHAPKRAEVVDLMARLRASLEGTPASGSRRRPAASKAKKQARGPKRVA
jgi:non-homologous end joining protein Ku